MSALRRMVEIVKALALLGEDTVHKAEYWEREAGKLAEAKLSLPDRESLADIIASASRETARAPTAREAYLIVADRVLYAIRAHREVPR